LQLFEAWTNSGAGGSFHLIAPPTASALSPATGP
jgi:hypothetical protein